MSERIADQLAEAAREGIERGRKIGRDELLDRLVSPEVVEAAATGHREKSYEGPKTSVALSLAALSAARAFLLKP